MTTLPKITKELLLRAVKQAGSYDPDLAMPHIESALLPSMAEETTNFLSWMHENRLTFGSGNIDSRYTAYLKTKEKV